MEKAGGEEDGSEGPEVLGRGKTMKEPGPTKADLAIVTGAATLIAVLMAMALLITVSNC
jgi:hypothetical protein